MFHILMSLPSGFKLDFHLDLIENTTVQWVAYLTRADQNFTHLGNDDLQMEYSTVQYSTVQYSAVQYSTVQYFTHLGNDDLQME